MADFQQDTVLCVRLYVMPFPTFVRHFTYKTTMADASKCDGVIPGGPQVTVAFCPVQKPANNTN